LKVAKRLFRYLIVIGLIWIGYLIIPNNLTALTILHDAFDSVTVVPLGENCSINWLRAGALSSTSAGASYRDVLKCGDIYLEMAKQARPLDTSLASYAVEQYPSSPKAWIWLANTLKATDRSAALSAYQVTLSLDPGNSLAWCESGFIYEREHDYESARTTFNNCCTYGDAGSEGCYGAGRMEEKLGNPQAAINAFLRSKWEGSWIRARELEKELGLK
jgi:tetratricopeptide (TPR) repeat protein